MGDVKGLLSKIDISDPLDDAGLGLRGTEPCLKRVGLRWAKG